MLSCPVCSRPTRVLTREPFGGSGALITRTCTAPASHAHPERTFSTYELPTAALAVVGPKRLHDALRQAQRGVRQRLAAAERSAQVQRLKAEGRRASTIARELGITEARVRQILKAAA